MENQQLFHNLVQLAAVDGKFTEEEIAFLVEKAELWGIPNEEFETALASLRADDVSLRIPPDRNARVELLRQMILMMAVDGELADTEKSLCAAASASMEFNSEEFEAIVDSLIREN
jgi:uncharacterized tellurite resistance protein B-like protein